MIFLKTNFFGAIDENCFYNPQNKNFKNPKNQIPKFTIKISEKLEKLNFN